MVVPEQCSAGLSYGVIIGQESIRILDLDISVQDNTIRWSEEQISIVLVITEPMKRFYTKFLPEQVTQNYDWQRCRGG